MNLVWLILVAVVTVNVCNAKSIIDNVSEKAVNTSAISKMLDPSPYDTRLNNSIFPKMSASSNKFVVSLKPTTKTENQTAKPDNNRKRLMKKLPITYVNTNSNAKIPTEITTRRSLMKIRKFTVRPHDIYAETVREKHNWNSNRKVSLNNFRKPKSESYVTAKNIKPIIEEESSEQRFLNFKNVDSLVNDSDSENFANKEKENGYVAAGSQKSKTILLFPKRNYTKYLKKDPKQKKYGCKYSNNSDSENKISFDVVNNQKDNICDDLKKGIVMDEVLIKSGPQNISDQDQADRSEFKYIYGVKKNDVSFVPFIDDIEMSTGSDLNFFVI